MTSTLQRGGGPRSLGASLLDQVLAETLDPAYRQAADAREARAAAGEERASARRRWGQGAVALVMAVTGVLAAVTYDAAAAGAQGREEVREALVADIGEESDLTDALGAELRQLRLDVSAARADALAATAVGQRALDELDAAEVAGALEPVTGPGLLVTLADAEPDADSDPVGGGDEEDPRGQVMDGDLQVVVNALWAAGAEAVSINGRRLGPTTAIRFAGEAVLVDFRPVANPYLVSAIGNPDTLRTRFLANPQVVALANYSASFGLRFDFAQEDELSLPAGSSMELRSAVPVSEEPAAPAADPSPGG
ncbi:DUF881 domain-containing protein [Geodermatophilus sabuli]|uniref:Uncharacterized conserved protein YlxW, UPF0749 family n=1 Tax=Geodermatophilus sabuli TaxID=1564158 RepID=A0A285EBA5_9ACTN|nr:DUF881 domain-containing protein [Geodermatophilus sabuli]MBB3084322.1 uncharacterized protein YlxW (UPF0749 family) [Geodermatophilus sabuli]SNX96408.1 Uncharacterized conserved protein YlxW, UPF0749 family [Geodermatophilus sabuli]